MNPVAEIINVI